MVNTYSINNKQIKNILYPSEFKSFKKVILIGNYGPGNFGDEVMLDVILRLISRKCMIFVPTRSPETLKELHPDNRLVPLYYRNAWSILKELIKCDSIIFGGGTIFTKGRGMGIDITLFLSLLLKYFVFKKIYFYGIGYSETIPIILRILAKLLFQKGNVYVRDIKSWYLIRKEIGINPWLIKDLTFYWEPPKIDPPPEIKKITKNNNATIVGLSITKDLFDFEKEGEFIKFLNYIGTKYNILILSLMFNPDFRDKSIGLYSDFYLYKKIKEKLDENVKFYILPYYPPYLLFRVIEHIDIVIGMRYHSLILAHLHSKPLVGIAVFDKQETFLIEHNYPYINLNELTSEDLIRIFRKVILTIRE